MLDRIDLADVLVTADALHSQHRHADYLTGRGAHYLLTVKRNQPTLHRQLRDLPWAQVPVADRTPHKGHGRIESRTVKLVAVSAGSGFPHARLAAQLIRRRRSRTGAKWHTETVYAVTDLRNLASSIHRLNDAINIAAACRDLSRHPDRVLPLVT